MIENNFTIRIKRKISYEKKLFANISFYVNPNAIMQPRANNAGKQNTERRI